MLARVKEDYTAGAVIAFSGREYVRNEWREVPPGFEEQAKKHELLETQPSLEEIRAQGPAAPGLEESAAVTVETEEAPAAEPVEPAAQEPQPETQPAEESPDETKPAEEDASSKSSRRRKRAAED